jgi:chromosome partitioning protein
MPVIVVANPKGGVGKSTLATNIAGCLAAAGHKVMLGDVDRQQSARQWLALRPAQTPPISGWDVAADDIVRPPKGTTHVVLDTPGRPARQAAGCGDAHRRPHADPAAAQPVRHPGHACLRAGGAPAPPRRRDQAGPGGHARARAHRANEQLHHYLATLPVPVVGWLRDTQNYVQLAARGLTLWDVAPSRVERDLEQWAPLADWVRA